MLTQQAWNSLLKTIEEPPTHVIFIFATTEPTKIIPTIVSRCERFNFTKLSDVQIQEAIKNICEKENVSINKEALKSITLLADGSLRDSLSILSQLSSLTNDISSQDINQMFGLVDIKKRIELIKSITSKNVVGIVNLINELEFQGIDFYKLTFQLIQILIDVYIYKKTKSVDNLKILNPMNINQINVSTKELLKMIDILEKSLFDIKTNSNNRFYFEIALLNCISLFDFNVEKSTNQINDEIIVQTKSTAIQKEEVKNVIVEKEVKAISNEEKINNVIKEKNVIKDNDINQIHDSMMNNVHLEEVITDRSIKKGKTKDFILPEQEVQKAPKIVFEANKKKISKLQDNDLISFDKIFNYEELYDGSISKKNPEAIEQEALEESLKVKQENLVPNGKKSRLYAQEMNSLFAIPSPKPVNPIEKEVVNLEQEESVIPKTVNYEEMKIKSEQPFVEHGNEEKRIIMEKPTKLVENESIIISNVSPIESVFYQIGSNTDINTKNELNEIFATIKGSIPKVPEEGYIVDALKILVASKNGFVFLFDDDLSCRNLNLISNEKNFVQYISKKFKKIYKVIGVTKADAKHFADTLRNNKNENIIYPDVSIDDLKAQFEQPASAKDIALEIFKDELE